MKKIFLLQLILLSSFLLKAQNNLVSVSTGALIPTGGYFPKLKYERLLTTKLSVGAQTNFLLDKESATGATCNIYLKTYFSNSERRGEGFYLQGFMVFGSMKYTSLYEAWVPVDDLDLYETFGDFSWVWAVFDLMSDNDQYFYTTQTQKINVTGAGFTFGKQKFFNEKTNFFYDINAGIKFCTSSKQIDDSIYEDGLTYELVSSKQSKKGPDNYKLFESSKPGGIGSIFIGFGYAF